MQADRAGLQADITARTGIDTGMIRALVHGFYDKVRADPVLAPIFAAHIPDVRWPAHLDRMCAFWSSVALMTGDYHGRPMQAHQPLDVQASDFDRWLTLFRATAQELTPPAAAAHFIERAERIAASVEVGIEAHQGRSLGRPGMLRMPLATTHSEQSRKPDVTPFQDLSPDSNVGEIAANLPGAASLFRKAGISFCCGGDLSVAEASAKRGRDATEIVAGLRALAAEADRSAPQETAALIAHIQSRYHDTHRRELADLIPLSRKVEAVHGAHPDAPHGLADLLTSILDEMESHMTREEQALFPTMLSSGHPMTAAPIAVMRAEHHGQAEQLRALEHVTHGFALPDGACRSWQALYAGAGKFADDLVVHMHLENDVLFPRFESAASPAMGAQ